MAPAEGRPGAAGDADASGDTETNTGDAQTSAGDPPVTRAERVPPPRGRATLLLLMAPNAPSELTDAVRMEAASTGYELLVQGPPSGETALQRASSAQSMGNAAGARATVWLETSSEETGRAVSVRVLEAGRDEARHAPLSAPVDVVSPRVFAAVVGSLLDEIEQPPQPASLRIRVQMEVENGDETIEVVAEAEAGGTPRDGTVIAVTQDGVARPVEGAVSPRLANRSAGVEPQEGDATLAALQNADGQSEVLGAEEPGGGPEAASLTDRAGAQQQDGVIFPESGAPDESDPPPPPAQEQPSDVVIAGEPEHPVATFGFDVIPFVGTSGRTRGQAIRHYSFNLLGGLDYGLRGIDVSFGFSYYRNDVVGVQFSGLFNYAGGNVQGLQLTSGLNMARGQVRGAQLGSVNVAGAVRGAQLGTVNIARGDVEGVQVGLVNYSHNARFALGLLNIVRNGRTHVEALGLSDGSIAVTLKHGGDHFHYGYGLLVRPDSESDAMIGAGMGLGAHITAGRRLFLDIDLMAYAIQRRSRIGENTAPNVQGTARAMLGLRLTSWLAVVAGAAYTVETMTAGEPVSEGGLFDSTELTDDLRGRPSLLLGLQLL